jgi:predicted  nucleic acid-binding Zn-ribbon protein
MAYKLIEYKGSLTGLVEEGYSELEELGGECEEVSSNFPNSSHPRAEAFADAASTLQGFSNPECDVLEEYDEECTCQVQVNRDKRKGPSRAVRVSNATAKLTAAADAMKSKAEALREEASDIDADEEGISEQEKTDRELKVEKLEADADALEEAADQMESDASEAGGVEFPGLYG